MKKLNQITVMNTTIFGTEFIFYRGTKTYRFVPRNEIGKYKMFRAIGDINRKDIFRLVYMSDTLMGFERR